MVLQVSGYAFVIEFVLPKHSHYRDAHDKVQTITFEHYNPPLENLWTSYEEALASTTEYSEGFGPEYDVSVGEDNAVIFSLVLAIGGYVYVC